MTLALDMEHAVSRADFDNFHVLLIRLMLKADPGNFGRLAKGFPNTAIVVAVWRATGAILDMPYEGNELA